MKSFEPLLDKVHNPTHLTRESIGGLDEFPDPFIIKEK